MVSRKEGLKFPILPAKIFRWALFDFTFSLYTGQVLRRTLLAAAWKDCGYETGR